MNLLRLILYATGQIFIVVNGQTMKNDLAIWSNENFFLKMGQTRPLFYLFRSFSHDKYSTNLTRNDKSIDGVLGTQTRGGRMVGADESTELWRHPSH